MVWVLSLIIILAWQWFLYQNLLLAERLANPSAVLICFWYIILTVFFWG